MRSPLHFWAAQHPPSFVGKGLLSVLFAVPAMWGRRVYKSWETGIIFHTWGIRLLGFGCQVCIHYQHPFRKDGKPC
jgi:hypothetical protein